MLTRLVVIIIIAWIVYIWFEWWVVYTINHDIDRKEENYKELIDEIEWWKKQTHDTLAEVNDWKDKFSEMQHMYNKERNEVAELNHKLSIAEKNLDAVVHCRKIPWKTIADKNVDNIISLFNEWLTDKEIAEAIGCWRSTIQRAVKKFWLR